MHNGVIWIFAKNIPKRIIGHQTNYTTMFPTLQDIAKRRRQLGLKQTELAKAAGVSQSLIAKLEAGTIDSSYTKVKKNPQQRSSISPKKRFSLQSRQYDEGIWIFANSSF
jgi:DNA-binding XRE family transcriptional regulator